LHNQETNTEPQKSSVEEKGNKIDVSYVNTEEGTEALRVLARLIARRLQREGLAKEDNRGQTIPLERNQEEEARA
jgi:hypothetical protein